MKYSAIVLDLDGTLLNTEKKVSTRNLNAILDCHKNGVKIIFATARPPRAVKTLLPTELLEIGTFVYYNGALINCNITGLDIHIPIKSETLKELLYFCDQTYQHIEISLEVKDEWYSLTEIDYSVITRRKGNPIVKPLKELLELIPTKILVTAFGDHIPITNKFSSKLNIVVTDNGKLMQIMSKEASKERAIKLLCDKYEIGLNQVISFGDDYNDLELLTISGYSVAMGNAIGQLKEIADEVTLSNDQDGVGIVLEREFC
jgi:Cof subfamily protein (haloacid dehalogenase superfamily)